MILVNITNPTDKDITEFPIAEPELVNGEVKYGDNGQIVSTGKTLLWSLEAGQTKAFPEYVARELLRVYEFLKESESKEGIPASTPEEGGLLVCKYCGQSFKSPKAMGLHWASKHQEMLK